MHFIHLRTIYVRPSRWRETIGDMGFLMYWPIGWHRFAGIRFHDLNTSKSDDEVSLMLEALRP